MFKQCENTPKQATRAQLTLQLSTQKEQSILRLDFQVLIQITNCVLLTWFLHTQKLRIKVTVKYCDL